MHYLWLCPICLALAVWFIYVERSGKYIEADIIKGCASLVFVILGWLGSWSATGAADLTYTRLIVSGLAVGAIADVVLNLRYVFEGTKGKIAFLAGILVFLAGHILYLLAVAETCTMLPLYVGLGVVLTVLLMAWILKQIEAALAFKIFGFFYIGAITVMTCVALGSLLANPSPRGAVFLLGAVLFLISDIVLILNTFGPESRFSWRVTNLILYYIGQLLIALSLQL